MASPQSENGHTDIANELVDALCRLKLSENQSQILWCVVRKTYGWHKKEDEISLTQFERLSGLSRPSVTEAIARLVTKQVLVANSLPDNRKAYSVQKDYEKWDYTGSYSGTSSHLGTRVVANSLPKVVANQEHTKETKETIQKKGAINLNKFKEKYPTLDIEFEWNKCQDFYKARGRKIVNWNAAFSNWFRNDIPKKQHKLLTLKET